jgi:uncharacterized protein (TIGR03437 family)
MKKIPTIAGFLFGCLIALAQSSTNINVNLILGNGGPNTSNTLVLAQTGSVGSLGNATLVMTSNSAPIGDSGIMGPVQITFELAFNEVDTIAISFTESDPNFADPTHQTVAMTGGTITGGTGAYAGASGSLDLTIAKDSAGALWSTSTTSGSGILTVGGSTKPLTLANFRGWCCGWATREQDYFLMPFTVTGNLGSGTGMVKEYYYFNTNVPNGTPNVFGAATINFNSTDSLILGYSYSPASTNDLSPPSTFSGNLLGGTGKYANAVGAITWTNTNKGFSATGAMTTNPGPVITQVKTIYGAPQVALNTWLEIHGHNLVPANTAASGVDWSNAPEFANGMMPTQLGPVGVGFGGGMLPGYIYWYCSAQTNPNCADDQINVLAPASLSLNDSAPVPITVLNNGAPIARTVSFRNGYSPAFLSFDTKGHIAARHLDSSLMAPSGLYPGLSTPAKAGETISLYGTGFGPVPGGIVEGSATQSGNLSTAGLSCWVSGLNAQAVGALVSPGLYQINLTIPKGAPSGDNPVVCIYNFNPTFPGALIAVQ